MDQSITAYAQTLAGFPVYLMNAIQPIGKASDTPDHGRGSDDESGDKRVDDEFAATKEEVSDGAVASAPPFRLFASEENIRAECYDSDAFVDAAALADKLCPICNDVARRPYELTCDAGHVMCQTCFVEYAQRSKYIDIVHCPHDRQAVDVRTARLARSMQSAIWKLSVRCSNRSRGCTVIIPAIGIDERNVLAHRMSQCEYELLVCNECGEQIERRNADAHTAECGQRPWTCPVSICQVTIPLRERVAHQYDASTTTCINTVVCPNRCTIPRSLPSAVTRPVFTPYLVFYQRQRQSSPTGSASPSRHGQQLVAVQAETERDIWSRWESLDANDRALYSALSIQSRSKRDSYDRAVVNVARSTALVTILKREEVESHRQICPYEPLTCESGSVSCAQIRRCDMFGHLRDPMFIDAHVNALMDALRAHRQSEADLRSAVERMQRHYAISNSSVDMSTSVPAPPSSTSPPARPRTASVCGGCVIS